MRKAAAILLVILGAIILIVYGTVMLRFPILDFRLRPFGAVLDVDPVEPPIWVVAFLTAGIFLLWRNEKPMPSGFPTAICVIAC